MRYPYPVDYRISSPDYRYSSGNNAIAGNGLHRPIVWVELQKTPGKTGFSARSPSWMAFRRSGVRAPYPPLARPDVARSYVGLFALFFRFGSVIGLSSDERQDSREPSIAGGDIPIFRPFNVDPPQAIVLDKVIY